MRKVVPTKFPNFRIVDPTQFGQAIRAARTQSGLTIAEAALSIGVAKQTISDLELGLGTVSIGLALKVAREVGVSFFAIPTGQSHAALNAVTSALADEQVNEEVQQEERPADGQISDSQILRCHDMHPREGR